MPVHKKNPALISTRGFKSLRQSTLTASSFGCFQWIDFCFRGYYGRGNVGRQIAVAVFPLDGRLGAGAAVPAGLELGCAVATCTGFNDLTADTAVVSASFSGHEAAIRTFANGLTNHGYHPLNKKFGT